MKRTFPVESNKEQFSPVELREAIKIKNRLKEFTEKYGKARTRAIFIVFEDMYLKAGARHEIKE